MTHKHNMSAPAPAAAATTTTHNEDNDFQQHRHHRQHNSSTPVIIHQPRDYNHLYSSLVAGAASGALASVLCAPLDLVRTRLQVWGEIRGKMGVISLIPHMIRDIVAKEGWRGCFRGLGATLITVPAFWGVYCKCVVLCAVLVYF